MNKEKRIRRALANAFRYEWFDVLMDRFYNREYCEDCDINDIEQDIARKMTFQWGFSVGLGIMILVWVFFVFKAVSYSVALCVITAILCLIPTVFIGSLFGVGYLFVRLMKKSKKEQEEQ